MKTARAGGSREQALPTDVHAGLVDTLFGTFGSFVSGIFGGLVVPVIAWLRTGESLFLLAASVIFIIAVLRVIVLVAYRRSPAAERADRARYWEISYAIGGVGFMTAVGLTAAYLLFHRHDEVTSLYGVVIVLGCAGSLAGRNAGRPNIVMGQILGVCAPVAIVLLFNFDAWYWGLSFIFLLVLTSVRSTTHFLNKMLVTALLSRREAERQGQILGTALNSMTHGLCMMKKDGSITVINQRLREVFDLTENMGRGRSSALHGTVSAANPDAASAADGSPLTIEALVDAIVTSIGLSASEAKAFSGLMMFHARQPQASSFTQPILSRTFLFRFEPMASGGSVMVVEDITLERLAAEQVERLAHFDTLTGLTNRFQFQKQLQSHVAGPWAEESVALLSIDLDRFKEVNDTLGHQLGDKLLQEVADRLRRLARPSDSVARFGGDEFQILLRPSPGAEDLDAFAALVVSSISQPYRIDDHAVSIGASVGMALAPQDAREAEDLIKCADLALYSAKAASRGTYRRFVMELDFEAHRKRRIDIELREALASGHLEVHYQPAVDIMTGKISTLEALVRWRHPSRGLIAPSEFIPVAEETGLIVEIGEFVLNRACLNAMAWPDDVKLAVNVSAKQFLLKQDLPARIMAVLARTGLPARRLELEITEGTLMEASEALSILASVGIRISLDDFGTGYSSLSYLRQFKIDKIKIDQSFVRAQDDISLAIVDAISFLAKSMNVDLVAEGVETQQQLDLLIERRIHLVQGYLFSKPKPADEIAQLLGNAGDPDSGQRVRQVA